VNAIKGFVELEQNVIEKGLCNYCGSCVGFCPNNSLELDKANERPVLIGRCAKNCSLCVNICPGREVSIHQLEKNIFGRIRSREEKYTGVYLHLYKGHACSQKIRQIGSSGGVGTALLLYALENKLIDGAVLASMDGKKPWRTNPVIARNRDEIISAAQSKYALVPINAALREVKAINNDKFAVTALPCHAHGIRKMQVQSPQHNGMEVSLLLGIICGCSATYRMTEHLIEEVCGVHLDDVEKVEYRGGDYPGSFRVTTKDGYIVEAPNNLRGAFMLSYVPDRCQVCLDWSAELCDLSLGDFAEARTINNCTTGSTLIICRSQRGKQLLIDAASAGYITIEEISVNEVTANLGLELKMHANAIRYKQRKHWQWPVPTYDQLNYPEPLFGSMASEDNYKKRN